MHKFRDCYSEEIIDTQGRLFELMSCEDIDFCAFITDYMNSNICIIIFSLTILHIG